MSVLYEDDHLLSGELADHLSQTRTIALYWRGVQGEIVRHHDNEEQRLEAFRIIDRAVEAIEALHEELCMFDEMIERWGTESLNKKEG